jgi:hypothetical protein
MSRPRGGYIGYNAAPAASALNSAASGVWTLREAEALKRAGTWPISRRTILDIFGNAAASYSLTSLRSAYTGPVVRVRRSSDNAEQDFTATEVHNGGIASFVGSGNGFVRTWYDQSGSANLVQSTNGSQPLIALAGSLVMRNGKPGIDFGIDGSSPPVQLTATLASNNSDWFAIAVVTYKSGSVESQLPSAGDFQWRYGRWISVGSLSTQDYDNTNSFLGFVTNRNDFGETPPAAYAGYNVQFAGKEIAYDTQYLFTTYKSASTVKVRVNNIDGESITQAGTLNATSLRVGANIKFLDEGNSNLWGVVQELIYYQTDRSSDVSAINNEMNAYYGAY